MQNIGRVNTFGAESRIEIKKSFHSIWFTELDANYTYQYSVDVSNKNSPTYLNQVAYIPRHTANFDYTLKRKNSGLHISSTFSSLRYSLTENIVTNEVKGFSIFDANIFTNLKLKENHSLRIQFSVKNIFNSSYAYIRYFVMPGRNYLITLSYALR
jgi:outer membrane receptor protein involved in Fe transport